MEKLGKSLNKYLMMSVMALMLVCFSVTTAFATESTVTLSGEESKTEVDGKAAEMLAKLDKTRLVAEDTIYSGEKAKPTVKLLYTDEEVKVKDEDITEQFIFETSCDNVNAGTAKVTAKITGYYETNDNGYVLDENSNKVVKEFSDAVSLTADFTITQADLSKTANVNLSKTEFTYDGLEHQPDVTVVTAAGKQLTAGTDYAVVFSNNINAGTSTAEITFKGNYTGKIQKTFVIKPYNASAASTTVITVSDVTYNGTAQTPTITVTAAGRTLVAGTDYTAACSNNTNVGTATAKIAFQGNYTGGISKSFQVKRLSISSASVTLSTTKYSYNGKDRKPGVTVKIQLASGTVTLKKDTDYTVSYSKDCKSIGTKTAVIKGKGNYSGEISKTYTVVPEKATGLKLSSRGTSSLKVTCTKAKVSGCKYQFQLKQYNSATKKWEETAVKNVSSNSATFTGLDSGRVYACYVRIYKKIDSTTYKGSWSSVMKAVTTPAKPVMSYAVRSGSKSIKAVWKAVSSATGYEIQYSTKSNFSSNVKTVKVKGKTTTSKTISGVKSSGTYYVRVRAYRTYNGKTYKGSWSSKTSTYYSNVYASYSSHYNVKNTNRSTNLRLACNAINGKVVANGEVFSFNRTVGQRTAAKGYKEATIYENGQVAGGIGGGVCQIGTAMYLTALKSNFTIVERHQHSRTVHYCKLGYDAAIAWGSKDVKFRNTSGTSIKIQIKASNGTVSVKFLTNDYRKPPKVTTKVTKSGGVYTLKRYVNGKVNFTTKSDYVND